MSKIKLGTAKTIKGVTNYKTDSVKKILDILSIKFKVNQGLKDIEEGRILTFNELKEDVANWKL